MSIKFHVLIGVLLVAVSTNHAQVSKEKINPSLGSEPTRAPIRIDDRITNSPPANPTTIATEKPISLEKKPLPETSEDIVLEKPNGNINWTQQYVEAKGESAIDYERFKNKSQARLMARRGAIVIAQRNLLEIVKGVDVVGETKVEDMIATYDYIYTRVEGRIKGARQIGEAIERDGTIEVTLRMPLYSKNGIASAFGDKEIAQAQLKNGYKNALMPMDGNAPTSLDPTKPIVFSVDGKKIDLSLFPVILDDNGQVQFDFSKLINTKTGEFPKLMQLSKEIMQSIGYQNGVNVIELIQNGKGSFQLPKSKGNGKFWKTVGDIARTTGRILFNIP
jgi:hypothetical protein